MKKVIVGAGLLMVLAACGSSNVVQDLGSDRGELALKLSGELAQTVSRTLPDPLCLESRARSGIEGSCELEVVASVGPVQVASPEQIAAAGDLVSADGVRLADAGDVQTRSWQQEARGFYYFDWHEKHMGQIYWNGERVWSTHAYQDYVGNHDCGISNGILYSVNVVACSTKQFPDHLEEWDYFKVSVIYEGFPAFRTFDMHISSDTAGNIMQYWGGGIRPQENVAY